MPTPDMFGRETVLGGVMSAEATRLTFSADSAESTGSTSAFSGSIDAGLIMQQLNVQYSQNVTRLYALEDARVYFVAGRTDGNLTIQHVIGPAGLQKAFIEAYSNVCNIKGKVFNLSLAAGCSVAGNATAQSKIQLKSPVITAINLQMQAQNMIIGSGITAMFVSLAITQSGGNNSLLLNGGNGIATGTVG